MDVFALPPTNTALEDIVAHMQRCREYLLSAPDPNESLDGRSLVTIAIALCTSDETPLRSLLERGADPNCPSAYTNFALLLTASNSLPLVKLMLKHGLRVNDIVEIEPDPAAMTQGPTTLLDYALAVQEYVSPNRKALNRLASKHSGGLGPRQRFLGNTIKLLRSHGAKRATELLGGDCESSSGVTDA